VERDELEAPSTVAKGVETWHTEPLIYKGRTIKDDSPDDLSQALAGALNLATKEGRLDLVERILAQVERRRG
jgi:hypothetical protein